MEKNFSKEALELETKIHTLLLEQQEYGFPFDVDTAKELWFKLASRKSELEDKLVATFEPTIVELKTKVILIMID